MGQTQATLQQGDLYYVPEKMQMISELGRTVEASVVPGVAFVAFVVLASEDEECIIRKITGRIPGADNLFDTCCGGYLVKRGDGYVYQLNRKPGGIKVDMSRSTFCLPEDLPNWPPLNAYQVFFDDQGLALPRIKASKVRR